MTEEQVFTRIDRLKGLVSLPEVLALVLKATEDQNATLDDLADIVSKDTALTSTILKVANSAFYQRSKEIGTIREAVAVLGTLTVKSLALSISVHDICSRMTTGLSLKDFWRHSLEVALMSQSIARRTGFKLAEEAFVAGLLHDIGILIFEVSVPKEYDLVWKKIADGKEVVVAEEEVLGTNHARAGAFVLNKWNLPERYVRAVREHHTDVNVDSLQPDETLPLIVNLANMNAKYTLEGFPYRGIKDFNNRNRAAEALGLAKDALAEVDAEAVRTLLEVAGFLDIDVGSPLDLVQKANEVLYQINQHLENALTRVDEQERETPSEQSDQIATDVLRAVIATFSHYFNNACATILGRSQLLDMALQRGEITDNKDRILVHSIAVIQKGVQSITNVLEVMKQVESFRTVVYHDRTRILDLKEQLEALTASVRQETTKV